MRWEKRSGFNVLQRSDSLTLTVPEEVTGQLRKSVTIPCTYSPSALYVEAEVNWYINTHTIIIRRDETGDYIPLFNNRGRISIKRGRGSGDVSLTLNNLAYSDRGAYTCEVKWQFKHGLNKTNKHADVNLIVLRALPSTRPPASLSPVVIPTSGFYSLKISVWVFVLTVTLIVLFFSVCICIMFRTRIKTGHSHELPSVAYESFPHQVPMNIVLRENNEYEVMTTRENEYSVIPTGFACVSENQMLQCEE
ncbi:uncharacterized protein [Heterodontus francisci]|uniref:uncharacterized protein isoform X2 n=1 Tax=Heterodontus francisci TaxID=7792 RepID=UPI00355BCA61